MAQQLVTNSVTCVTCLEVYTWQEPPDCQDAGAMPDGYLTAGGWICDSCGSCPGCGTSLEKEPSKRAYRAGPDEYSLYAAEPCKECGPA